MIFSFLVRNIILEIISNQSDTGILFREKRDNGLFITLVPKVFLIRWLNNFGDFVNFDWLSV